MKNMKKMKPSFYGDVNLLDPWNIELWGREVLAQMEENTLAYAFVNQNYANEVSEFGHTINARVRASMSFGRKNRNSDVVPQQLSGSTVPVVMNNLWYCSFVVPDWGAEIYSFGDVINTYLAPAAKTLSDAVNRSVLAQAPLFLARQAGGLGTTSPTNVQSRLAQFNGAMNEGQDWSDAPLFVSNSFRTNGLQVDAFMSADRVGDDGSALQNAYLGKKYGMMLMKSGDVPGNADRVATQTDDVDGATAKGSMTITLTDATGFTAAMRIDIGGKPYRIASVAVETLTLTSALVEDVADATVVKGFPIIATGATSYAAEHGEPVAFTAAVVKGDIVDIELDAGGFETFTVIQTTGGIYLDRPLPSAVTSGNDVSVWPAGSYNFGFTPNSMLLATRPLHVVKGLGPQSTVVNYKGLALRLTLSYEGRGQQILVTMDILGGFAQLFANEGGVLLG